MNITHYNVYKIVVTIIFIIGTNISNAQNIWNLEKCITYAITNNIQVKQQELNVKFQKNTLVQSQLNRLPAINAGVSGTQSYGSSVDPFTSDFTEIDNQSANLFLSASMNLFNGFQNENKARMNQFNLMASVADLEKMKNDISLNIAAAYLMILFNDEIATTAKIQVDMTRLQVARTAVLVNAGSLPKGSLLEVQAQLANEELQLINNQNQLRTSYLTLKQLLQLDSIDNFSIEKPQISEPDSLLDLPLVEQIYNEAIGLPQIKSAELKVYSAQKSLAMSKGGRYPRLSLSASIATGYSSARSKYEQVAGNPVPFGYVGTTGDVVFIPSMITNTLDYPYNQQFNDNVSKSISLNLSIPIFNNYMTQSSISNSKINVANYEYQLQAVKNNLYNEIQSAHNDVFAAQARFKASVKAIQALEESFNYTQQKFDLGLMNSIDYTTAKNNLTKAQSDYIQAKYDYVFKMNVINFYRGKPLKIN